MVTETSLKSAGELIQEQTEVLPMPSIREIGERSGLPIIIRPWWGSFRRKGRDGHVQWACPSGWSNRKKNPEIQGGKIVIWEGPCHYDAGYSKPHTHTQIIEVKDARPGAVLITIRLGNTQSSLSQFLLGMDSGNPYAVRVGLRCQTINEALDWLVPKIVKSAIAQGLDVKRQGDWWFIPHRREPNRHEWDDHLLYGLYKRNHLYKNFFLVYHGAATRHRATWVIFNTIFGLPCEAPIVKGKVRAPNHEPLLLPDWHIGVRNRSHPWRNVDHQRQHSLDD